MIDVETERQLSSDELLEAAKKSGCEDLAKKLLESGKFIKVKVVSKHKMKFDDPK